MNKKMINKMTEEHKGEKEEEKGRVNFGDLDFPISPIMLTYSHEVQLSLYEYMSQLDKYQRMTYCIAFEQLQSSFSLIKSNGYNDWLEKKKQL